MSVTDPTVRIVVRCTWRKRETGDDRVIVPFCEGTTLQENQAFCSDCGPIRAAKRSAFVRNPRAA